MRPDVNVDSKPSVFCLNGVVQNSCSETKISTRVIILETNRFAMMDLPNIRVCIHWILRALDPMCITHLLTVGQNPADASFLSQGCFLSEKAL